jgi:hypothetical protein
MAGSPYNSKGRPAGSFNSLLENGRACKSEGMTGRNRCGRCYGSPEAVASRAASIEEGVRLLFRPCRRGGNACRHGFVSARPARRPAPAGGWGTISASSCCWRGSRYSQSGGASRKYRILWPCLLPPLTFLPALARLDLRQLAFLAHHLSSDKGKNGFFGKTAVAFRDLTR